MNNQIKDSIQELEYIISIMREVSINEEKLTIKAIDPNDNDLELELYEVATVYRSIIDGCGPCGGIFEEEIDFRIDDIEEDYKNKSKEEFLNYVGHLYYAKYRCIEIYDRLQDIEDEA